MRLVRGACAVLGALLAGCVSSPDVKEASASMTTALAEYDQNVVRFQNLWVAEIKTTQDELGKAIVAREVMRAVQRLAGDDGDFAAHEETFKRRGLIALSEEIEQAQDAARRFVARLKKVGPGERKAEDALEEMFRGDAGALRRQADELESSDPTAAEELRARASGISAVSDPTALAFAVALVELGAMRTEIPRNLANLRDVIRALRETHATVDEWIQTDVTVSGQQIATLMDQHAKVLGLD